VISAVDGNMVTVLPEPPVGAHRLIIGELRERSAAILASRASVSGCQAASSAIVFRLSPCTGCSLQA
jgi:hypothetical protein